LAPAWGLGTPSAPTWRLGYALVLGTSQCIRGSWACASVVGTLLRTRGSELLPQCIVFAHTWRLGSCLSVETPQHTRDAWAPASVLGTPLRTRGA